ncbi:SsrA-binding protein SmpB [Candidatus Uhrbacteria bacterium]|nr:SsrA-binding protein SmpB [Candidatus Uhrbacteria bacterium]
MPRLAFNKRAKFDYEILESFEAGLALTGQEVKSVRAERMGLAGAFVTIHNGAAWLTNAHIPKYDKVGPLPDYDPDRSRKLLLHRREISRLIGKMEQKGLTLVPISVYTKGPTVKLEFGLARGKRQYQKKEAIKRRDVDREIRRSYSSK